MIDLTYIFFEKGDNKMMIHAYFLTCGTIDKKG